MKRFRCYGMILLLLSSIIWGSAYISMDIAFSQGIGIFSLLSIRFIIGGIILSFFSWKKIRKATKKEFVISFKSALLLFLMFLTMSLSLRYNSPSRSGSIFSVYLIFILILNNFLGNIKVNLINISYSLILMVSIFYLNKSNVNNSIIGVGDLYSIVSGLCFAFLIMYLEMYSSEVHSLTLSTFQMLICGLISIIFIPIFKEKMFIISKPILLNLIYISIIVTCLAYYFQNLAMNWVTSDIAATIMALQSLFTVVISLFFYKQSLNKNIVIGLFLMVLGIILMYISKKKLRLKGVIVSK